MNKEEFEALKAQMEGMCEALKEMDKQIAAFTKDLLSIQEDVTKLVENAR